MTTDPRWARIAVVESVGVSRRAERHRQEAIGRFAQFIELEANRLAAAGVIPTRDFQLTSVAVVGAINGLVNTWTTTPDWTGHLDDVVEVATNLIVATITQPT